MWCYGHYVTLTQKCCASDKQGILMAYWTQSIDCIGAAILTKGCVRSMMLDMAACPPSRMNKPIFCNQRRRMHDKHAVHLRCFLLELGLKFHTAVICCPAKSLKGLRRLSWRVALHVLSLLAGVVVYPFHRHQLLRWHSRSQRGSVGPCILYIIMPTTASQGSFCGKCMTYPVCLDATAFWFVPIDVGSPRRRLGSRAV